MTRFGLCLPRVISAREPNPFLFEFVMSFSVVQFVVAELVGVVVGLSCIQLPELSVVKSGLPV
jgi:hypothetical protein